MQDFKHLSAKHMKLVKEAHEKLALYDNLTFLKHISPLLATAAGISGVAGLVGYYGAHSRKKNYEEALKNSFLSFSALHPEYQHQPHIAQLRFNELSLISPTLATNPTLAHKVIAPRMESGFSIDDIHRLASIEHMTTHTPKPVSDPASHAAAVALGKLETSMQMFGPDIMRASLEHCEGLKDIRRSEIDFIESRKSENIERHTEKAHRAGMITGIKKARGSTYKALQDAMIISKMPPDLASSLIRATEQLDLKKESSMIKEAEEIFSEQKVSDECMGRMMATRYMMLKEAGVIEPVKKFFSSNFGQSASNTGDYLKLMAVPLAIGIGFSAINKLMKMKENKDVHAHADRVYAGLRRSSDVIRGNPELANEAFDALKSFSPVLATKPLIARTFVEDIVNKGGMMGPQTADMLASAQQKIMDVQQSVSGTKGGFLGGLKEPMGLFSFSLKGGDKGKS